MEKRKIRLGIDVGSTTVKLVIIDAATKETLYSCYRRHQARQRETLITVLSEAEPYFKEETVRAAVCGSGGKPIAQALGVHYIQEVVANAAAVCEGYPGVRTAIELGGQDAKVIFFHEDSRTGELAVSDMRMNGSCAGGTGAFIDEIAALLDVEPAEFERMAERGQSVYDISGRCGVFAKTDIQPLLISGTPREDIALSTYHAIAKQTIGGLSQGLELTPPIIFEGGPLTFHPTLVKVFAERLHLKEDEVILPEHPETIVAYGTALAVDLLFPETAEADIKSGEGQQEASDRGRQEESNDLLTIAQLRKRLERAEVHSDTDHEKPKPLFVSKEEREAFERRHDAELLPLAVPTVTERVISTDAMREDGDRAGAEGKSVDDNGVVKKENVLRVYMGIDSGSTTSKIALMDEQERMIDWYYDNNHGKPLDVVRDGILHLYRKYEKQGLRLEILGLGTTGYGEQLFAKAFGADYHVVETVAHSQACLKYFPDTTFLLDIGGQDMKAIWMDDGIITNIMLNEACSSGCGSFLENFASTLEIPVEKIADAAFSSEQPASLGSRCTVFMNSTIINEQRDGRQPNDIMAGLCRSIIENVFTKVVRIGNKEELGNHIVVQGGTFRNRAVLRALEEYLGKEVTLAPYPGEMGAFGAALLAKREIEENGYAQGQSNSDGTEENGHVQGQSSFIGIDAVRNFSYTTQTGAVCPLCANHCSRTITHFSTGDTWVTGNRCERGAAEAEDTKDTKDTENELLNTDGNGYIAKQSSVVKPETISQNRRNISTTPAPDLYLEREKMLFSDYPCTPVRNSQQEIVGLPRVLEFWDSMPFWSTFFRALGYRVKFSHKSSQKLYEDGLTFVASDTICFPAKLAHGHVQDLAKQGADRIFMPYVMHMPPEGQDKLSPYVCSVVQGYPMVVRNAQSPEERYGVIFDTPVFHFFQEKDRRTQIVHYACETLGASKKEAQEAFGQAEEAIRSFRSALTARAQEIIDETKSDGGFAVVLAGRPYHNDAFISHGISQIFAKKGVPVLTADSLPGLHEVDLLNTRIEITNDFHTRMLEAAVLAARSPELEYVQLVSFGCGHDAVLSDEIIRIMNETAKKPPLILKIDESAASGSVGIRIQSFIETVQIRRNKKMDVEVRPLPAPSPVKFYKEDKKTRTLLIPNISAEVSVLLCAICEKEHFKVKSIEVGSTRQIRLGKQYVHNDICFPCQMVIGELIGELQTGNYRQDEVAVGMVKFQCDCRMSHYAGLLRKGLDAAGFTEVPIVTTDVNDTKVMHPGVYLLGISAVMEAVWSFMMLDMVTEIVRKIRPYECNPGETERIYQECVQDIADGIRSGIGAARKVFEKCIDRLLAIPYDRSKRKPVVFVTGELLVTYHPGSNFHIEEYLEKNGMETAFPRITDQLRKDFQASMSEISEYHANIPPYPFAVDFLFNSIQKSLEKVASRHPLFTRGISPRKLYEGVRDIIPETLSCGEGWLMAAEIAHYAKEGMKSFVILQPFGCLPNHICGRGVIKKLKDRYPDIRILPLDLDPDTSYANVENRLQMLVMKRSEAE